MTARTLVASALVALILTSCGGPSDCEKAGGREVLSHYLDLWMPTYGPKGEYTGMRLTQIPVYECEMPS